MSSNNRSYQQLAAALAIGAGALYILSKLLREVLHKAFPRSVAFAAEMWIICAALTLHSYVPGQPNTALLASPRPNVGEVSAKDLEGVREYDYVIIGTGTAGSVLASRLSEDQDSTVLAIEAGHSDLKQIFSRIPAAFGRLFGTAADWNYYTEKEGHCNDRKYFWPRGKML